MKIISIGLVLLTCIALGETRESIRLKQKRPGKSVRVQQTQPITQTSGGSANQALMQALTQVQKGQYLQAAPNLFQLSRRADFADDRDQIKFILGSALLEANFNQIAAFQFVEVIKGGNKKYLRSAIEKLSIAADRLGDDTLLNYAIGKVNLQDFPGSLRDMILYRIGEVKTRAGFFAEAEANFAKVPPNSRYFYQARYQRALAMAESNRPKLAAQEFRELAAMRSRFGVHDPIRLAAQMGLARSLYQSQDWDGAIEAYRDIPRDSDQWYQSLFESTWALLRNTQYRSALGQFHSLHSAFFAEDYNPESLILRGITYLYICKFEETQKTIGLFSSIYDPIFETVRRLTDFKEGSIFAKDIQMADEIRNGNATSYRGRMPQMLARRILSEGDINRTLSYIDRLRDEMKRLESSGIGRTQLARYGIRVLNHRMNNATISLGELARIHLLSIRNELKDLKEQASFLELETSTGKAELLKKKISGKSLAGTIDSNHDRTFYVQNGYEYWPFNGEYWIDELGNYHYLGKSSCE